MRTITISEIPGTITVGGYRPETNDYETKVSTVALKATVEPPVPDLNPEAVTRYIGSGKWNGPPRGGIQPLGNVLLVGSTEDATTIYASVQPGDPQHQGRELFASRTSEFLGFMGIETTVAAG